MNLKEKYGEWGVILGATEGVGKAFLRKNCSGRYECRNGWPS